MVVCFKFEQHDRSRFLNDIRTAGNDVQFISLRVDLVHADLFF